MQGNIGWLVVVDHFSKWLSVVPIRNKTAKTVVNMLEHRILPTLPRMPDRILTDNGPEFSSEIFSAMLTSYGIKHIFTTPYRPASNGCVERVNRTIGEFLKNIVESPGSWDTRLGKAVMVYNNTKHSELGMSPAEFLLTKPHSVLDSPIIVEEDLLWSEGHPKYEPFHLGQLVKKKRIVQDRSVANKFKPKYDGPFEVIKINDNKVTYKIRKIDNGQVILAHHSQLIRWNKAPPYLQGYPEYRAAIAEGDPNYPEKRVTTADEVDDARSESSFTSSSTDDDYSYESIAFSSESEDFSGFENSTEILKRILHSTPARLESLPNINLGKDQSSKFSGFASPTSPPQRSYRVRNSLSPIKQCLSEARDRVEQARRSSRLRIQMLKRVINASQKLEDSNEASDRPGVATPDINSIINLEEARQTRSSGPVPDYPNVQRKIMERRGNQ
jgi:hypothetical protein